jgi:hypothetical protein
MVAPQIPPVVRVADNTFQTDTELVEYVSRTYHLVDSPHRLAGRVDLY